MSLRDEWLSDPEPLPYVEWLRRRTVPAGLLVLQTPEVQRQEREKVARKPSTYKRKSRANPDLQPKPLVHGSTHAWKRHKKAGEEPCPECVVGHEAEKARRAADKRALRAKKRRQPPKCGTPQAARRHRRRGEIVDEACKQSERDEWRKRNPSQKAA